MFLMYTLSSTFLNVDAIAPTSAMSIVKHAASRNYTVSKNDTDFAHYNFNPHQLILVIFGRLCKDIS